MALPNVGLQYQNGGLGRIAQSDDRVMGLIISFFPVEDHPNDWPFGTPKVLYSPNDLEPLIAHAPESLYKTEARRQVADFYKAAPFGSELWIAWSYAQNSLGQVLSASIPRTMLEASGGRIACLGISQYPAEVPTTPTLSNGIDVDIYNALDDVQAMAEQLTTDHMPVRVIVEGRYWNGNPTSLIDLRTLGYNRVAVLLSSGDQALVTSCMGLLLGRLAATAPNVSIGRVRDGAIMTQVPYMTDRALLSTKSQGQLGMLNDKGYIFLRNFFNKAGYYWNDDPVAAPLTDDYYSLANGRVIDKAARIAYATFVDEINDTVLVDAKGKILKTTMKQYQARIERAIGLTMGANNEISNVEAFVDPDQDVIGTSKLVIDLRITPTGTNRVILVKLGLYNPNAA